MKAHYAMYLRNNLIGVASSSIAMPWVNAGEHRSVRLLTDEEWQILAKIFAR